MGSASGTKEGGSEGIKMRHGLSTEKGKGDGCTKELQPGGGHKVGQEGREKIDITDREKNKKLGGKRKWEASAHGQVGDGGKKSSKKKGGRREGCEGQTWDHREGTKGGRNSEKSL